MIEFSCSCGKKYRLPDRNAEREVRCNQCEKTLIVPKRSQTEPVVPLSDQIELIIEQENVQSDIREKVDQQSETPKIKPDVKPDVKSEKVPLPAAEPVAAQPTVSQPTATRPEPNPFRIERKVSVPKPMEKERSTDSVSGKKVEQEVETPLDAIVPSVAVPSVAVPTSSETSNVSAQTLGGNTPQPDAQPVPQLGEQRSGGSFVGTLLLVSSLLVVGGIIGIVLGFLVSRTTTSSSRGNPFSEQAEMIERQLDAADTESQGADDIGKPYTEAVAAAFQETDAAKRTEAMKQAETLYRSFFDEQTARSRKTKQTAFLGGLAKEFRRLDAETLEVPTPFVVDFSILNDVEPSKISAADWKITKDSPFSFDLRTADGAPALLSFDGDPTSKKSGKQSTLDELAVVLDDDQSIKGTESHTISLRVDSASAEELCVAWPRSRDAGITESDVRELKFCIYFSGTANAIHKPGKPQGLDKTLELADFRLRLGDAWGDIEFILTEKERVSLCEKGRLTWYALSVPINGDDVWKRVERGRMSPKKIDFIEFRAKPTGNGLTFWIDNLSIGK